MRARKMIASRNEGGRRTFILAPERLFQPVCWPTERGTVDLGMDELEAWNQAGLLLGVLSGQPEERFQRQCLWNGEQFGRAGVPSAPQRSRRCSATAVETAAGDQYDDLVPPA